MELCRKLIEETGLTHSQIAKGLKISRPLVTRALNSPDGRDDKTREKILDSFGYKVSGPVFQLSEKS